MIPAWTLLVLYATAAATLIATAAADFKWASPSRLFLAAVMLSWAAFYGIVQFGDASFDVLRALSRWLHAPTAVAITLIPAARWYHAQKWNDSE